MTTTAAVRRVYDVQGELNAGRGPRYEALRELDEAWLAMAGNLGSTKVIGQSDLERLALAVEALKVALEAGPYTDLPASMSVEEMRLGVGGSYAIVEMMTGNKPLSNLTIS